MSASRAPLSRACPTLRSRVLRCVLVVAAWQSPLPLWHSHGTLADPAVASPWLAGHLRTCHAVVDPLAEVALGWHLHFTFPESGEEGDRAACPAPQHLVVATGIGSWEVFSRFPSSRIEWGCDDALTGSCTAFAGQSPNAPRRGGGFLGNFAADMPLPVRLGVLRC